MDDKELKRLNKIFYEWKQKAIEDEDLVNELKEMEGNNEKILDSFFKEISFGTGGIRGVLGAGTNRMNIYTVRKASQGLANYIRKTFKRKDRSIAISYDSRNKSKLFAETAAEVFAANGIHVYIYRQLMPTPCLSFAVRELKCAAGIMVTASHNPAKYNGYKVYGNDGCQITSLAAEKITKAINSVNPFKNVKTIKFEDSMNKGNIKYISKKVYDKFINRVKKESVVGKQKINRDFKIVYSPLNGTGLEPVKRILKEAGFKKVVVVKEQEKPDGNFPTCPFPNPEIKEAMALGMKYAKKNKADLLIATDPDCDRVGIAVKDGNKYTLLSGNQTGVLLLNYICELRTLNKTMPKEAHVVKTIVTTEMADKVAEFYNVKLHNVLTGFKYIGDVIKSLEEDGKESSYILGFEESYGYLTGSYVRDKDAVNASLLICEMFAYYKTQGISLIEKLNKLYKKFGYYYNKLDNFVFEGAAGFGKMQNIMKDFRNNMPKISKYSVEKVEDYLLGINGLPKSDVIKFYLKNGSTVVVRPSGTEPKLKMYCNILAKNEKEATEVYNNIRNYLAKKFN